MNQELQGNGRRQAVVVGAGIGGLAAAAALAPHCDSVIVLERDELPANPAPRRGTPQDRHVHGLLAGGLGALEALLPGFERDLLLAGAVPLRNSLDVRVERPGFDPFPARDLGISSCAASRPLIEHCLRRRLAERRNVRMLAPCRAVALVAGADGQSVTGVQVTGPDADPLQFVPSDLVVDASGRGRLTLDLLRATGRALPPETVIGVDIAYSSASFVLPEDEQPHWKGVMTFPRAPQSTRGALLLAQEGGRWLLGLAGRGTEQPPGDEAGFETFVRDLRTPTIHQALSKGQRIGDIARHAFPSSRRRRFGAVRDFPRGLLPLGDAVCTFNPVYGQGMSVAAQQARLLGRLLAKEHPSALARAYFGAVEHLLETPWEMSALPDFVFPQTTGPRPADMERRIVLGQALLRLAARDPAVHRLSAEVQHLLKPRSVYRRPVLAVRLAWEAWCGADRRTRLRPKSDALRT